MPRPLLGITPDDCPFCQVASGRVDAGVVAYRGQGVLALPSLHQRDSNRGHTLVVPEDHIADLYRLPADKHADFLGAVREVALAVRAAFGASGITVQQHNEFAGGQDVFHLHAHVVPRFVDDGFYHGPDRFPMGLREVPLPERQRQARLVADHIGVPEPAHPRDVHATTA